MIFEMMKAIGIPHHDCCTNFWNELCGSATISKIQKGLLGAMLISPKALANFSLW